MRTYEQSALASTAIRKSAFARSMSSKRDLFTWWQSFQQKKYMTQTKRLQTRQACSPLIQWFFGFASDIDQTNINRDIRDGNWLSHPAL